MAWPIVTSNPSQQAVGPTFARIGGRALAAAAAIGNGSDGTAGEVAGRSDPPGHRRRHLQESRQPSSFPLHASAQATSTCRARLAGLGITTTIRPGRADDPRLDGGQRARSSPSTSPAAIGPSNSNIAPRRAETMTSINVADGAPLPIWLRLVKQGPGDHGLYLDGRRLIQSLLAGDAGRVGVEYVYGLASHQTSPAAT